MPTATSPEVIEEWYEEESNSDFIIVNYPLDESSSARWTLYSESDDEEFGTCYTYIHDRTYDNCPEGWEMWGADPDEGGWDMPDSWYD